MKKNINSKRSLRFLERNDLNNIKVRIYVESIIKNVFCIKDYKFLNFKNYGLSLFVNDYILAIDKNYIELKVFYKNKNIKIFYGDSCWYQAIKFTKEIKK